MPDGNRARSDTNFPDAFLSRSIQLDLLFTNKPEAVSNLTSLPPFGAEPYSSDHNSISFNLKFSHESNKKSEQLDYHNADYEYINNVLLNINWTVLFANSSNLNLLFKTLWPHIKQVTVRTKFQNCTKIID